MNKQKAVEHVRTWVKQFFIINFVLTAIGVILLWVYGWHMDDGQPGLLDLSGYVFVFCFVMAVSLIVLRSSLSERSWMD